MPTTELLDLARRSTRTQFIASYPGLLLVGSNSLTQPPRPATQLWVGEKGPMGDPTVVRSGVPLPAPHATTPPTVLVMAVRKTQPIFASMITVGRTANNDICLDDNSISRFHAFFQTDADTSGLMLADAGSTYGTMVDGRFVPKKGLPVPVLPGSRVRFGALSFTLLEPGPCWDLICKL